MQLNFVLTLFKNRLHFFYHIKILLKNDRELKTKSTGTVNPYKIKLILKNKIKLQSTKVL